MLALLSPVFLKTLVNEHQICSKEEVRVWLVDGSHVINPFLCCYIFLSITPVNFFFFSYGMSTFLLKFQEKHSKVVQKHCSYLHELIKSRISGEYSREYICLNGTFLNSFPCILIL